MRWTNFVHIGKFSLIGWMGAAWLWRMVSEVPAAWPASRHDNRHYAPHKRVNYDGQAGDARRLQGTH